MATVPLHPDARLRVHNVSIDLRYDGTVGIVTHAEVLTPDGKATGYRESNLHVIRPEHSHWPLLMAILAPAVTAHYDRHGLDSLPLDDVPFHLHPQGYAGVTPPHDTVGAASAEAAERADPALVRAHIVAVKDDELLDGTPRPVGAAPAQPQASEIARRDAYITAHATERS